MRLVDQIWQIQDENFSWKLELILIKKFAVISQRLPFFEPKGVWSGLSEITVSIKFDPLSIEWLEQRSAFELLVQKIVSLLKAFDDEIRNKFL